MTRKVPVVLITATLLSVSNPGFASADIRRERPARRPYIVEIGQPYSIGTSRLQYEIGHISELDEYVTRYGYPDYAEIQETSPEWPWAAYEVRVYYLQRNVEADFSPVFLSPAAPNFGVLKFRGDITPEKRHEIELVLEARAKGAAPAPAAAVPPAETAPQPSAHGLTEALVARIEAAAERAALAADRAAAESEAAVRAADRTVTIVEEMQERGGPAR